jgi:hypothetical protein
MALQGNLRDFSVSEILQMIGTQTKTGCLVLTRDAENLVIFVSDGRVVSARDPGMRADDPLLALLRGVHRLSEEQYRGLITLNRETGRDLEDLLLNGRYMEQDELAAYVERQILDTLLRLSHWENGSYRFDPAVTWKGTRLVKLSAEGVLIEAARRVDEQKRFRTMFSDPHQILGVRDLPDPDEPLSDEERELFGIIDGNHTLAEVTAAAPLTEYETHEALHRLMEAGWIEMVGRRDPGNAANQPAAGPAPIARRAIARELFASAGALVLMAAVLAGGHLMTGALPVDPAPSAVFVSAQVRDLRRVLDLYRRENGGYPERLEQLVEARWIQPRELRVPGHQLRYQRQGDGADYRLGFEPIR